MSDNRVRHLFDGLAAGHTAMFSKGILGYLARRDDQAMLRLLQPVAGGRLLDVGCGSGTQAGRLANAGLEVCAVDLSSEMVEATRPLVQEAMVADLETLSLGRRFDRVMCLGVLDFVKDPENCIGRLAEHVGEGGRLLLEVPRRSPGGYVYRLLYRLFRGIWPTLFDRRQLDVIARRHGLVQVGYEYPFFHSLFIAWQR